MLGDRKLAALYFPRLCIFFLLTGFAAALLLVGYFAYGHIRDQIGSLQSLEKLKEELFSKKGSDVLKKLSECGDSIDFSMLVLSREEGRKRGRQTADGFSGFSIDKRNLAEYEVPAEIASQKDIGAALKTVEVMESNVDRIKKSVKDRFDEVKRTFERDSAMLASQQDSVGPKGKDSSLRRIRINLQESRDFYPDSARQSVQDEIAGCFSSEEIRKNDFSFAFRPKALVKSRDDFLALIDFVRKNLTGSGPETVISEGVYTGRQEQPEENEAEKKELEKRTEFFAAWIRLVEKTRDKVCEHWKVDEQIREVKSLLEELEQERKSLDGRIEETRRAFLNRIVFDGAILIGLAVVFSIIINLCIAVFSMEYNSWKRGSNGK